MLPNVVARRRCFKETLKGGRIGSSAEGTSGPTLPEGITGRLKDLIRELEQRERPETEGAAAGQIELSISENEALWFVAYRTVAE